MAEVEHARLQAEEIGHVAVDHRQILDGPVGNGIAQSCIRSVQGFSFRRHIHRLGDSSQRHFEIDGGGLADQQVAGLALLAESGGGDPDGPGAGLKLLELIFPARVGGGLTGRAGGTAGDGHRSAGHNRAACVGDTSG